MTLTLPAFSPDPDPEDAVPRFLDWEETSAKLYGLSRRAVAELLARGEIRGVMLGRRRFFIEESVDEYLRRLAAPKP